MDAINKVRSGAIPPTRVRNFCMLAHVDHGKTTMSDFLLSNNGVLSEALAGQVRYLDSRPDEQERLITMKASCVALNHKHKHAATTAGAAPEAEEYLCNLVDSPGHIDFSCEVSTALRVCDGGVIIVDIIDGATMQTHLMLRQALLEGLSMMLVINKIDLAIVTQGLTAEDIYAKVSDIVTSCNVALAALVGSLQIHAGGAAFESRKSVLHGAIPGDEMWFSPAKGNVLFASCLDGWGFTLRDFAKLYAPKLPFSEAELMDALWGEHYIVGKSIETKPKKEGQPPLFVTHVIQLLCTLYEKALEEPMDLAALEAMAAKVGVSKAIVNHPSRRSSRQKLAGILSTWLPLATRLLDTICESLDSPPAANQRRLSSLMPQLHLADKTVRNALWKCSAEEGVPLVAFCAKLLDVGIMAGRSEFVEEQVAEVQDIDMEEMFVAFGRIYCGVMKAGQQVIVQSGGQKKTITVTKVFALDGTGLIEVDDLPAGCLFCMAGASEHIVKSATFSTDPSVPMFRPLNLMSSSILKQTITPKNPSQLPRLLKALRVLNQTDAQLELNVLPTGDHVICCAGEVHSERCVVDLEERFARGLEFELSPPIVTIRETIVAPSLKPKQITCRSFNGHFSITMHALPLPQEALEVLKVDESNNMTQEFQEQFLDSLKSCEQSKKWDDILKNGVWAYACRKFGFLGSVLINGTSTLTKPDSAENLEDLASDFAASDADLPKARTNESGEAYSARLVRQFQDAILSGFEVAAGAGPMAEEPIYGVAFVVDSIDFVRDEETTGKGMTLDGEFTSAGTLSGQVLATVAKACRDSLLEHGRRIVEPHYQCTVQSAGQTQGKIYGVLARRRAEILDEVLHEGSDLFHIDCSLPAFESFGLIQEMRDCTHGAATAQLRVSHWDIVDADPYFKPTTKEEIEEMGSRKDAKQNIAEMLLEKVRRRKGLHRENTVEAEKQKFSMRGS